MKKSGLADSPFFPSPLSNQNTGDQNTSHGIQPVYEHSSVQMNVRTPEQTLIRTSEPMNARTDEQTNNRTDEHKNVGTHEQVNGFRPDQPARPIHRQSYNIHDDQAEAIDALALRWRKERGRHITKGEVVRELLDAALKPFR
ncbi:MAG: hypothetical protein L6Q98_24590 [Anaerolineae bacterium]|nr:hypothetical protein [Anaerolineae bacterium]NUQ06916.1 hypothetical protein [Anaerolineae bacterium]